MTADFGGGLVLSLIKEHFVFFKKIPAFGVDRHNQRTKFFYMAVPKRFRHAKILPLCLHNLFHLCRFPAGKTQWIAL